MQTDLKLELFHFLKGVSFLQNIPEEHIRELADYFELLYVEGGHVLIKQGDSGDCLYVVHSGCFVAYKMTDQSQKLVLSEIKKAELIGELALFTEEKRAANVVAIRDSMVWKLSKKNFDAFFKNHPSYIMPMIKPVLLRLLHGTNTRKTHSATIALIPAGRSNLNLDFVQDFVSGMSKTATTRHINLAAMMAQFPDIDFVKSIESSEQKLKVISWLGEQETKYQYIIYEADQSMPVWSEFCRRQADKILLIADAEDPSAIGPLESPIFKTNADYKNKVKLILLHPANTQRVYNTSAWLAHRHVEVSHIRKNNIKDIERIIRLETGQGIALVLGGGGAKALAHLGVYKALCELKIPIDRVAGTSMGSIVAGSIGLDLSAEFILSNLIQHVIQNKKFYDYTVPVCSLLEGQGWINALKSLFPEEICIEDLWKNFFCIASNFTTREMEILNSGSMYQAVRASASLPGVVPPISNKKRELLIDGGIFNNLPVDIMKNVASPCQIIAVRVSPFSYFHADISDGVLSGLKHYFSRFKKNQLVKEKQVIPSIGEMIIGSITMHNDKNELIQLAQANFALDLDLSHIGILNFAKYPEIIDFGYRHAMETFSKDESLLKYSG